MSEIKVNKISPKQTCTQLTLGDSGDTIIIPAGATITNSGTATGFGPTGAVSWDTTPKTTTVTAVSGTGYFINTTSGAVTVNLPAGSAGSIVALSDYAATWNTNNVTVSPNGTNKIGGVNANAILSTQGQAVTFVYVDSTQGWTNVGDATKVTGNTFVTATGGTITTCGNYKIHTFTGPGTFTVTYAGTPAGSTTVDYMVVAGGGGGGATGGIDSSGGGGGGAGGFRESVPSPAAWTASPLASPGGALPVSVTSYPITVGAGGSAGGPSTPTGKGVSGSNSVFSTITSAGGGGGGGKGSPTVTCATGVAGGSGGGAGAAGSLSVTAGSGNTPPTTPSQGNPGGPTNTTAPNYGSGGGGGAGGTGSSGTNTVGGNGAPGSTTSISGSPTVYAGGGGGSTYQGGTSGSGGPGGGGAGNNSPNFPSSPTISATAGTANRGGGGGGMSQAGTGGAGGSGIVVIRYKFQ